MTGCVVKLQADENRMSAETSCVRGVTGGHTDMVGGQRGVPGIGQGGKFKPYAPFNSETSGAV